ncbi:MAG TPA: FliM/FliN family flagellar motor switch protein [Bryobacterales bacterium]|jgi:flagellar motor switch protein FliN/FliY|nr:FliM/FliN family flagellar motor switch protein [Bryobacterales bacterium]
MPEPEQKLARFYDVPIELSVELDRRTMKVREILGLRTGSLIKMNRSAGDNMSLLLAGVVVGYGEIVVIEDTIGIRITDFLQELK